MLGAIFLCGVRDIRPRPYGILHAVMMVESSFQLSESAPREETWLPVLWNLDDLKIAQAEDRVEAGDWTLSPAQAPAYLARLRSALFCRAQEHHQIKYAAAMAEECRLAHPQWASRILAPAAEYVANPHDPDTEVYLRSPAALEKGGIAGVLSPGASRPINAGRRS